MENYNLKKKKKKKEKRKKKKEKRLKVPGLFVRDCLGRR